MTSPWAVLARVVLVLAVVGSVVAIARLDDERWGEHLRARFVYGLPWGSFLTVGFVLAVYLVVQGGLTSWGNPVSLPFRAWSYRYPLGMVVAPFAHVGPSHLVGNLVGTLALAPLAEYAWGHYPPTRDRGRGSAVASAHSHDSRLERPLARILAVPAAVVAVGLFTAVFSVGPIIGFSGVVFAFAGFTLVRYPLATVVAFAASGVIQQVYVALRNPVVEAGASGGGYGLPWWATVAIQAHALGLLTGVVVGIAVFYRRERLPSAGRLWLGTLVFAIGQSLWAVYWFRGNGQFVLFRALGVALVFALAFLVAASVATPGRVRGVRRVRRVVGIERRAGATMVLLLALAVLAAPAVPVNLTTTAATGTALAQDDGSAVGTMDRIHVRDYTIYYAENVTNRVVSVVDVSAFGESTTVNASGVIVESGQRSLWTTGVEESRLAFAGCATVGVGGLGWRESVHVSRTGWKAIGGGHAYKVRFGQGNGSRFAYLSGPATADATVENRNVSVVPRRAGFGVVVSRANETVDRVKLPANGTTASAGGLRFNRTGGDLFVAADGTRVRVASRETYR
ncbi:rhomboid family intramembrane serine protease [Halococcus hamelinensis]|uniref:Uncharacterized protein n=1 Tax=Halococcus hamelinensis 100A6 TaxID=1132509 RepID=M0M0G7_9EURY|nr:rhomboid family intramembrane serine protease [Halococcus hamelinensis]EMA38099.1 hypothetical protein C447_10230 [Halococcus hamelinensis 100A6]